MSWPRDVPMFVMPCPFPRDMHALEQEVCWSWARLTTFVEHTHPHMCPFHAQKFRSKTTPCIPQLEAKGEDFGDGPCGLTTVPHQRPIHQSCGNHQTAGHRNSAVDYRRTPSGNRRILWSRDFCQIVFCPKQRFMGRQEITIK